MSRNDEVLQKAHREGTQTIDVCSCSGNVLVAPHTKQYVMFAEISVAYNLPPGRYTVGERQPATKGLNIFIP